VKINEKIEIFEKTQLFLLLTEMLTVPSQVSSSVVSKLSSSSSKPSGSSSVVFSSSRRRNIETSRVDQARNIDLFASEIRNYAKGGDWSMKEHAVEFRKDICASFVARNENKGPR